MFRCGTLINETSWEDSNLKFNTCKLKGQNKYNLVNHKKIKVKKTE